MEKELTSASKAAFECQHVDVKVEEKEGIEKISEKKIKETQNEIKETTNLIKSKIPEENKLEKTETNKFIRTTNVRTLLLEDLIKNSNKIIDFESIEEREDLKMRLNEHFLAVEKVFESFISNENSFFDAILTLSSWNAIKKSLAK